MVKSNILMVITLGVVDLFSRESIFLTPGILTSPAIKKLPDFVLWFVAKLHFNAYKNICQYLRKRYSDQHETTVGSLKR